MILFLLGNYIFFHVSILLTSQVKNNNNNEIKELMILFLTLLKITY